jgi:hypothetical protein
VAAALLTREWRPDDPWWPGMAARCSVGLGGSRRPAANFVRAVVDFSSADTAGQRDVAIEAATTALAAIDHSADEERPRAPDDEDDADFDGTAPKSDGSTETARIFERGRIRMLLAADRRDEALAAATRLLEGSWTGVAAKEAVSPVIETLTWATELGLAPIVERLHAARPDLVSAEPLVTYAAAAAERARGDAARATTLADAAFARQNDPAQPPVRSERMQAAMLLARWGCVEWAVRGYTAILDDTRTQPAEYALTAIIGAEYLHELDRDTEAAAFMGRLLGPDGGRKDLNAEQILAQLGRDHRTSLARMHYFSACVAGRRGDTAEQRRLLETALRSLGKDIDSLIALYHLPDNTPDQRGDALRRINEALRQIDNEIQGMPEEANGYNEYAWLVANTVGDVEKATRYSKQSLVKSFDNSSYLDTLAHCRAAAGDLSGAIRWQSLAHRHEPHNTTIRRNLDRFEAMAAAAKQP